MPQRVMVSDPQQSSLASVRSGQKILAKKKHGIVCVQVCAHVYAYMHVCVCTYVCVCVCESV